MARYGVLWALLSWWATLAWFNVRWWVWRKCRVIQQRKGKSIETRDGDWMMLKIGREWTAGNFWGALIVIENSEDEEGKSAHRMISPATEEESSCCGSWGDQEIVTHNLLCWSSASLENRVFFQKSMQKLKYKKKKIITMIIIIIYQITNLRFFACVGSLSVPQ